MTYMEKHKIFLFLCYSQVAYVCKAYARMLLRGIYHAFTCLFDLCISTPAEIVVISKLYALHHCAQAGIRSKKKENELREIF